MFFPQTYWWDDCQSPVPDGVRYLCERWWELLKDWFCITVYAPQCSYHWSLLEDLSDILGDLQQGHLRSSHTLNAVKEEVLLVLSADRILRNAFPAEIESLTSAINSLFDKLPPSPQDHFAELKKRKTPCRRAAMAARRLHHRCSRRRVTEESMTWTGVGGLIAADLFREVLAENPDYGRIDRLVSQFLLDSLYRGYNINYLTTLFDRYLSPQRESPGQRDCRDGLLHAFRRIHTRQRHQYDVFFALNGATELRAPAGGAVRQVALDELHSSDVDAEFYAGFTQQLEEQSVVLCYAGFEDVDAGAAAEGARKAIEGIVDLLDFHAPMQDFKLSHFCLVTWRDQDNRLNARLHPDTSGQMPARTDYVPELEAEWSERRSLSEAFRWWAVAQHEDTPEVSLLACWFAFEFLAADIGDTPIEGIMEFFPKALAIGNLRRRLEYWYRCLQGSPTFKQNPAHDRLDQHAFRFRGATSHAGILQLLVNLNQFPESDESTAIREITAPSVLLRERTAQESRLFGNPKLLAQTMSEDCRAIRWDMQRFLYMRNRLVHQARLDHPLLVILSNRAKRLLYDLLRDIVFQTGSQRLVSSVGEVLHDFRDTFDELLRDLGSSAKMPQNLVDRILLS